MITVLVAAEELAAADLELVGDAYRHLFRSRRLPAGTRLRLVDGEGRARWGEVSKVGPKLAVVTLGEAAPTRDPVRSVRLLVAPPRSSRASWLVEKATELGVEEILWLAAERCSREIGEGSLERLRRVASAALEQSHGARLPRISGPWQAADWESLVAPSGERFYLDPEAPTDGLAAEVDGQSRVFAVGPEGGWTGEEQALLEAIGCVPLGLGERVLRVETAAIAAASLALLGSR